MPELPEKKPQKQAAKQAAAWAGAGTTGATLRRPVETYEKRCTRTTAERFDFVDITDEVRDAVAASGCSGGRATVFSTADACPLLLNERESGLLRDIRRAVDKVSDGSDDLPTTVGSKSVVLPVVDGHLRLGRWQRLLLFELEQPSERSVTIQVIGE